MTAPPEEENNNERIFMGIGNGVGGSSKCSTNLVACNIGGIYDIARTWSLK